MNKWSEIKQATLDKLFLTIDEADDQGYLSKFRYLANEALNIIANGVKPKIVAFKFGVYADVIEGNEFEYDTQTGLIKYKQNGELVSTLADKNVAYVDDTRIYYFDNKLKLSENSVAVQLGSIITIPDDFLSFTDTVAYRNNEPYDDIVYLSDVDFTVNDLGNYLIYYNATWQNITEEDIRTDNKLLTHTSVLNCLPTYIAAQVLAQDDVQRSSILKNEFELMLSRLDTNVMYQNNHYRSSGGWY